MADPSASFGVKLVNETSGAADEAADSLENLKSKIDADVKALAQMKRAMRNLKGETSTSAATFNDLKDRITAQKASVAQSQASFLELGGTFDATKNDANDAKKAIGGFGDELANTKGPLGALGGGLGKLKGLLMNPVGAALALAAGFIMLAVAAVKAAVALAKYAIAQSGARREEALAIEGLNTLSAAYGRSAASAEDQQAAIDRGSDSTNVARGRLGEFSRQLSRTGLRGQALAQATEAMAIAQQVQGDRGAARFRAMAHNIRLTGGDVSDLADRYKNELGPIAERQMRGLGNQSDRLGRSMDQIFGGLELDPIEEGFESIVDLFSQSSVTGRALKQIVESMLQPVIDQAGDATPMLVDMFEKAVIGGLLFAIGIQDLRIKFQTFKNTIEESQAQLSSFFDVLTSGGSIDEMVDALTAATPNVLKASEDLGNAARDGFAQAVQINSPSQVFEGFGANIAAGVVNGMRDGERSVASASERMADASSAAFRNRLDIASPSGIFAGYGANISEGVSMGIDDGAEDVQRSVDAIVNVPSIPATDVDQGGEDEDGSTSAAAAGSTVSFTFGDIVIGSGGDESGRDQAVAFREELARVLSNVSIEMGAS